ncbi:MAG: polysaccharide deacetylase family protein [Eubacteriales bacterium]
MKRQIVNIINFIRAVEPRLAMDLVTPVKEQIKLADRYGLKTTFLLQYDALIDDTYVNILRGLDVGMFEIGVWLEVVQPLAEKAGAKWNGRYPWDWHSHCGFSVGYTKSEREAIIDVLFTDFHEKFGYYPRSFGSWAFDAHTLNYVAEKYGLDAACNCKDQWGTDGYNMWGGYYGQGYYPNKNNVFAPARSEENKIDVPVFRMLGSDPISQYDLGLDVSIGAGVQGVASLEPVYNGGTGGGGVPAWVDWYMSENFSGRCLSFGYAQAGQENSFGWDKMSAGLEYQYKLFASLSEAGNIEVETLGETGRWYKQTYSETPASVVSALRDMTDTGRRSVWYSSKNYRVNLYAENGRFWIRDIHMFRDEYRERYLDGVCTANDLTYDNLPVIDGNRFSGHGIRAGLYPVTDENDKTAGMKYTDMLYTEENGAAVVTFTDTCCGDIIFKLNDGEMTVHKTGEAPLILSPRFDDSSADRYIAVTGAGENGIMLRYNGFDYRVGIKCGKLTNKYGVIYNNGICLNFNQ